MDFEAYRDLFPIFAEKSYLNTCSLGPLSIRVVDALDRFQRDWRELGAQAWYERWMEALEGLRRKIATLIGASREEIALAPSVSYAVSSIASCLRYDGRGRVVTTDLDFPTIPYQWLVRPDANLDMIQSEDSVTIPLDAWEEALYEGAAIVATSHVFYATGFLQDVSAIGRMAHTVGGLCIIDGYHATGQLPVDVRELGVDVYISGSLKWLLGGPGLAFMWVRRELIQELKPTFTGWFANAHQFDFDPRRFAFREDARRFEVGTPSMASVFAADAGLGIILEAGPGAVRRRTLELATDLIERAEDAGLDVRAPPADSRTGIVMIESEDAPGTARRLVSRGVIVDSRGSRVRISPYFYNTPGENETVVDLMKSFQ